MSKLTGSEIRSKFLNYFKNQKHTVVESSAVVPQNDPTLLFTNAGMVQFKDVFTGSETRPYKRATSSQKCIRAGGKHNDLENVGFTARHHTFFEMLGNFSFGDYFKKEAIHYAWEFVTKELKLDKDKLYVTVFTDDDEAAEIWEKQEGVPKDRIYRFGEKDNFWSMGDTGPCGPCSEIFIDRGKEHGCKNKNCQVGCECDRFIEFWNLVFMQFNRDKSGKMTPLPKPSVDTGAGLERIAAILQDVETNYDTDIFTNIMSKTSKLCGVKYDPKNETAFSFRVIADHARATTFLIGDGVLPSNEGRGYVLRRIMRRAIRHGKKLGFEKPFMNQVCEFVIDQMKDAFPDLKDKKEFIRKAVIAEEEQFLKTLERGLSLLDEEVENLGKSKTLSGEIAFKLYDTYGFPLDLTRVILEEKKLTVDEKGFEKCMKKQRETSRKNWKGSGETAVDSAYQKTFEELKKSKKLPKFVGYDKLSHTSKCVALFSKSESGLEKVQSLNQKGFAVFAETPFYGESGGQTGDRGKITGSGFEAAVVDVQKPVPDLIVAEIDPKKGEIEIGKSYAQETDTKRRSLTAKNHTATHLLHWALHKVLGDHVKQAGSLVNEELLRFDFTHFEAMTSEEVKEVENLINEKIWNAEAVSKKEMAKDAAIKAGAIAFFGEKYGDKVRVVKVGDFSTELCGGTHVSNSSDIHLFKIQSESGIASGVRRIVAFTSQAAYQYLRSQDEELKKVRDRVKASSNEEIIGKIDKVFESEKAAKKQLEKAQSQNLGGEIDSLIGKSKKMDSITLIASMCASDSTGIKRLRDVSDRIKQKVPDSVIVLGMKQSDSNKALLLAAVGPKASKKVRANDIIKELAPSIDGRGGGKPDMAQAGGTNINGLDQAIQKSESFIKSLL